MPAQLARLRVELEDAEAEDSRGWRRGFHVHGQVPVTAESSTKDESRPAPTSLPVHT
jgi:hypothetical protein